LYRLGKQAGFVARVAAVGVALLAIILVITYFIWGISLPFYAATIALVILIAVALPIWLHRYIRPQTTTQRKDYVQLLGLAIGGIVGIIGIYFAWAALDNAQKVEQNRASEAALQSYLQHMQTLIVSKDLSDPAKVEEDVRAVAQAQTVSLFNGLRPEHKSRPLLFLHEAGLIKYSESSSSPSGIISLQGANLSEAQLNEASLKNADLHGINLGDAKLHKANLRDAYLNGAILQGAEFDGANLEGAKLDGADLRSAKLDGVVLIEEEQLQLTIGNEETKLPPHIDVRPPAWEYPEDVQEFRLRADGVL